MGSYGTSPFVRSDISTQKSSTFSMAKKRLKLLAPVSETFAGAPAKSELKTAKKKAAAKATRRGDDFGEILPEVEEKLEEKAVKKKEPKKNAAPESTPPSTKETAPIPANPSTEESRGHYAHRGR